MFKRMLFKILWPVLIKALRKLAKRSDNTLDDQVVDQIEKATPIIERML